MKRVKLNRVDENEIRVEALKNVKEIQSQLTVISFLDVLAVMDPANPLRKQVEEFEEGLTALRQGIEQFVAENQFDTVPEIEAEETPETKKEEPKEPQKEKIKLSGEDKVKTTEKEVEQKDETK